MIQSLRGVRSKLRCWYQSAQSVHSGVKLLLDDESNMSRVGGLLSLLGFEAASSSSSSRSATRYHHYGLNIDLVMNSQLGKFRRMMNKGNHFAHVVSIDLYPAVTNPHLKDDDGLGIMDLLSLSALSSGSNSKRAIPLKAHSSCAETAPRFTSASSSSLGNVLGIVRPRELVIPIRGDETLDTSMSAFGEVNIKPLGNKHPGLFKSENAGDDMIYRLVPCTTMSLMLQVYSIDSAESHLVKNQIPYERLGNEMSQRELQVLDPSLSQAIDIRLSEQETPNLFWREGSTAVIEGTNMQSLHNSRVLAGQEAGKDGESEAFIDTRTLNQDCWVETRERVKSGVLR